MLSSFLLLLFPFSPAKLLHFQLLLEIASHLHFFPVFFPLITYSPLEHPASLFFPHLVCLSSLPHLQPICLIHCPLSRAPLCFPPQLLANKPCEPTWFLFLLFHFLFLDFPSTSLNPPLLKVLLLFPFFSFFLPVHADHFKVQFQSYKTLRNSSLSTLRVCKHSAL